MSEKITLKRTLSLPMMILYGLGTTIGAGIYALVGELVSIAGFLAPVAFIFSALLAALTAMSFAELSGRFPQAAGAALYVKEGFSVQWFSTLIGLAIILAGVVSAAALVNGFVGYFNQFVTLDRTIVIVLVTLLLGIIAAWGIAESVMIAALITLIEVAGLLIIIAVSYESFSFDTIDFHQLLPTSDKASLAAVYGAALLAFYAFIGFEDMVDVAEEVKNVKRNLPIAILATLSITTILYVLITLVAVLSMPLDVLAASAAPLSLLFEHHTGMKPTIISAIGMFAIVNGALIQIIMASRVLYGLSSRKQLPQFLSIINNKTRTPLYATIVVFVIVLILALLGRLASLAELTSVIMLIVFSIVNLALWRIKHKNPVPEGVMIFPFWVPILGFLVSFSFVLVKLLK